MLCECKGCIPCWRYVFPLTRAIGTTNHTLFSLPVRSAFKPLSAEKLKKKQKEFRNIKCIIIEEYACTSQEMLGWINIRAQQFKSNSLPFGGMSVFMVGDPSQLPPVGGVQMFDMGTGPANSTGGLACYQLFEKVLPYIFA
jgi:hypothetical protein